MERYTATKRKTDSTHTAHTHTDNADTHTWMNDDDVVWGGWATLRVMWSDTWNRRERLASAPSRTPSSLRSDKHGATGRFAVHVISRDSTQVPQAVLDLKGTLKTLDVSVNRLTSLPPSLADFSLLRTLNISHNRLS